MTIWIHGLKVFPFVIRTICSSRNWTIWIVRNFQIDYILQNSGKLWTSCLPFSYFKFFKINQVKNISSDIKWLQKRLLLHIFFWFLAWWLLIYGVTFDWSGWNWWVVLGKWFNTALRWDYEFFINLNKFYIRRMDMWEQAQRSV